MDAVLEELGLTKESFDGSVKDYRLSGAYRKLFVKPNGITGRVIEYSKGFHAIDWFIALTSDWNNKIGLWKSSF